METTLSDAAIADGMIGRLVERLLSEEIASADLVVQVLMCLSDPFRRPLLEAAVSCGQGELEAVLGSFFACAQKNASNCEAFFEATESGKRHCPFKVPALGPTGTGQKET